MKTDTMPTIARLTGRCANGAQRDSGSRSHVVMIEEKRFEPTFERALCGAKPGRLSNGWVEVDGAEQPTCPRCRAKIERRLAAHRAADPHCSCNDCIGELEAQS